MKQRFRSVIIVALLVVAAGNVNGQQASHGAIPAANAPSPGAASAQVLLEKIKSLEGTWDAPMATGVITDIFKPFAMGTKVLGEEWVNGKQITSTVFYMVGS